MKRILISLIALLLALSMIFVGCNEEPPANNNQGNGTPNTPPADTTYTLTENYLPDEIYTQMKAYFESKETGFYPYDDRANAPLVCTDVFVISNAVVKSITIPVFSTGKADSEGNFTFSIYILPNDWSKLRTEMANPAEPIVIKVNAEEHGLAENTIAVRKFVKVDLTEYDIVLTDKQTLGFSSTDDTLIPGRVETHGNKENKEKHDPAKYLIDNWDVVGYYYADAADEGSFTYSDDSLLFDFEFERTYESEAAYNAMIAEKAAADADYAMKLAAVKAAYSGKSISVMGDSISTFNTISNNPALGLGDNSVYSKYTLGAAVYHYGRTYWGNLAVNAGMDLCVINSWGAGMVYGRKEKFDGKDAMLLRTYNLATATDTPELILLNYGINDMGSSYSSIHEASSSKFSGNLPSGNLYQRLTEENTNKTTKEIVAEWFAEVEARAAQGGYDPNNPATITFDLSNKSTIYDCWEAAYALSLQNIKRLYPDAEVYCITLPDRNHSSSSQPRLTKANLLIEALAEYFEVGFIDQANSGVTRQNCIMYASDGTGLHPNGKGHMALTKAIVEVLYENLPK